MTPIDGPRGTFSAGRMMVTDVAPERGGDKWQAHCAVCGWLGAVEPEAAADASASAHLCESSRFASDEAKP